MAKRIVDEEMRFSIIINGDEAQDELHKLEKSTRDLTASNKLLKAERAKLFREGKRGTAAYKNLSAEIQKQSAVIEKNRIKMTALQKQIGVTGLTMNQLKSRARQLSIQLDNMVEGSSQYKKLQAELKAVSARMNQLKVNSRGAASGISNLANGFNKYAALGASLIATITGVVFSLQQMIDYNGKLSDAQSDVMKTTGLTKKGVDDLAKSFGVFKTRTSRIELLKLGEEAGRLGIKGAKNIKDFIVQANKLKVALGDDLSDEAIRDVGKLVDIYSVGEATGKDFAGSMDALGSAINEVSASGANQAGYLVNYLKRQAGIAAQAKISATDNLGYAATFDEIGQSVEIAATAMNKVFLDMYSNPSEYAKIAGVEIKEFTNLLNTDANAAMIKFLEGLNGNNDGFDVMVSKLEKLDAGGARGAQALSALASKTDLLKERQLQANVAQTEAISLTNEYSLKNNNLAGTIDKVKKRLIGIFSSKSVTSGLNRFLNGFAKLIGAVDDVNEAFAEQSKVSFENAKANRALASSGQALLEEYEDLTKDGLEPTEDAKLRLQDITVSLKNKFGESVVQIDKETGAYILNSQALREQIKLKRLAADEEAATLASRLVGVKEREKEITSKLPTLKQEVDSSERLSVSAQEGVKNTGSSRRQKLINKENIQEVKDYRKAVNKLNDANAELAEQERRRLDILEKLAALNFSEEDANKFIKPNQGEEFKDGDTQIIEGQLFIYKGGRWQIKKAPSGGNGDDETKSKKLYNLKREQEQVEKLMQENAEARASLISEEFEREIAQAELQHQEKIRLLQNQKASEAEILALQGKADTARAGGDGETANNYEATKQIWLEKNDVINAQLESQEYVHQMKVATIIEKARQKEFANFDKDFKKSSTKRATANANELASIKSLDQAKTLLSQFYTAKELQGITTIAEAKEALKEQYRIQELAAEGEHLKKMVAQMEQLTDGNSFANLNLAFLPEEEKAAMLQRLEELRLALALVAEEKAKLEGGGGEDDESSLGGGDQVSDMFGMTANDWESMFENIENGTNLIGAMSQAASVMMNLWGAYGALRSAQENREMAEFNENLNERKLKLEQDLKNGLINQRQHDQAIEALEREKAKRQAEIEYEQAKRQKEMAIVQAVISTAMAIMQAYAQMGPVGGTIAAILIAALGAFQIATIAKQPLPSRSPGYEDGLYPVVREQDGKRFNVRYGGRSRSGVVNEPTQFIAGEGYIPEYIINGTDYSNFSPEFKQALDRQIYGVGVTGYEGGLYQNRTQTPSFEETDVNTSNEDSTNELVLKALERNTQVMEQLLRQGVEATLRTNTEAAQRTQEMLDDYNKLRDQAKIN